MIAERSRPPRPTGGGKPGAGGRKSEEVPLPLLYLWVAPDGDAYEWGGNDPIRLPTSLGELAATHDGLDRPVAFLADGWRLFHARPRLSAG